MPTGFWCWGDNSARLHSIKRPTDHQKAMGASPKKGGTKDMRLKRNRKLRGRKKKK